MLVSGENKVLVRKLRFGKTWNFIRKTLKPKETWSEAVHLYALYNLNLVNVSEIKKICGREFEGSGDIEKFWMILLNYTPKLPKSLFYKYMWVDKENAKIRTRNYGPYVFYYIQKYFGYVDY